MLVKIKVVGFDQICDLVKRLGVDEDRAEQTLLSNQGEG